MYGSLIAGWKSLLKFYSVKCIYFAAYTMTVYNELETGT